MEILYCSNCRTQVTPAELSSGKSMRSEDGKVYCAKCAPLYEHATSSLLAIPLPQTTAIDEAPTQTAVPVVLASIQTDKSVTKFYFCETCGKRVTDKQIEAGHGRDKKLKGVYCEDCAVGVMTMEFAALTDVNIREEPAAAVDGLPQRKDKPRSSGIHIPAPRQVKETHSISRSQQVRRKPQSSRTRLVAGVSIGVLAVIALLVGIGKAGSSAGVRKTAETLPPAPIAPPIVTPNPPPLTSVPPRSNADRSPLETSIPPPLETHPAPPDRPIETPETSTQPIEMTAKPDDVPTVKPSAAPVVQTDTSSRINSLSPPEHSVHLDTPAAISSKSEPPLPAGEYSFDFKKPDAFDRFHKLLVPLAGKDFMDLKSSSGRAVFKRTNGVKDSDSGAVHLQSSALKYGKNWDLRMNIDFHIGADDVNGSVKKLASFCLRFLKAGEKVLPYTESHQHFAIQLSSTWGGSFHSLWGNIKPGKEPIDSFDGIQMTSGKGYFPLVQDGKIKKPATEHGVYLINIAMRQSAFKVEANGVLVAEYTLPAEAIARIADSYVAVFLLTAMHGVQIDLEEFSFTKLDIPEEQPHK